MEYRVAGPADTELIAGLHTESWRRTYRGMYRDEFLDGDLDGNRREVWRGRLERPEDNQLVYIALEDGRTAGFVCAYGAEDARWGSLVDNLHVADGFRRRGIASALMREAGAWLDARYGDCGVYLWVLEANESARRFYEALGATDAETVHMEVHPGGWARTCRYVWPRPGLLAGVE